MGIQLLLVRFHSAVIWVLGGALVLSFLKPQGPPCDGKMKGGLVFLLAFR